MLAVLMLSLLEDREIGVQTRFGYLVCSLNESLTSYNDFEIREVIHMRASTFGHTAKSRNIKATTNYVISFINLFHNY